jgi:hypothetical protein
MADTSIDRLASAVAARLASRQVAGGRAASEIQLQRLASELMARPGSRGRASEDNINRLASALAARFASRAQSPAPANVDRLASAVARRLASGRNARRLASAVSLRLASGAAGRGRGELDRLASAVAVRLASAIARPPEEIVEANEVGAAPDAKEAAKKRTTKAGG